MKIIIFISFLSVINAIGFGGSCPNHTDVCNTGLECAEIKAFNIKKCLNPFGHICKIGIECGSSTCLNGKCDKCIKDSDCYIGVCNKERECIGKSGTGGKCERDSHCSQDRAPRYCNYGVCVVSGIGKGGDCPDGIGCKPGLYCDQTSKKCEGNSGGGCNDDSDCNNDPNGNKHCCRKTRKCYGNVNTLNGCN